MGGQAGGVGALYFEESIGTITRSNNIFYGMRSTSFSCPTGYSNEVCTDPLLINEPTGRGANFVRDGTGQFQPDSHVWEVPQLVPDCPSLAYPVCCSTIMA